MADKHYVGEIGTSIILDCGINIVGASEISIKVKKPDGALSSWDASIYGSQKMVHISEEDDFDQNGRYFLQASLKIGTWEGRGETAQFEIYNFFK